MAKAFWPGYRWRILAHKRDHEGRGATSIGVGSWHCTICGWKGTDHKKHPKKCPAGFAATWGTAPKFGSPEWDARRHLQRALKHSSTVEMYSEEIAEPVQFDELVIDSWFHLEQMSERHYWMHVGDYHINVQIDGKGQPSVSVYEDKED